MADSEKTQSAPKTEAKTSTSKASAKKAEWNVETHGEPTDRQREQYKVVGE